MPRLLYFVPCERVIRHEGEQAVSLFSLLESVTINLLEEIRQDRIMVQMRWAAYSHWVLELDEVPSSYEQRVYVVAPDESEHLAGKVMPFEFSGNLERIRITAQADAFPAWIEGLYYIVLAFRERGSKNWTIVSEVPFLVKHNPVYKTAQNPASPDADPATSDKGED